jgi:stress-induced morphogen
LAHPPASPIGRRPAGGYLDDMPMDPKEIARLIKARFPDAQVTLKDLAGDGDHFAAHVVAKEFTGKTRVQQHKMVYEALEGRMGGVLHALALTTTPPKD